MPRRSYSQKELKAFRSGLFFGLQQRKKNSGAKRKTSSSRAELLDMSERYRTRNLGALVFNGKIYDTNFKGAPKVISKAEISELRKEYGVTGRESDREIADRYVRHMRRKFGVFGKDGEFLGLLGEQ